jgi:hypothetical protein
MAWQIPWRRIVAGGCVLLLHILLILALLTATRMPISTGATQLREIMLTLVVPRQIRTRVPEPHLPNEIPVPALTRPEIIPRPITILPPEMTQPPQQGDIRAIGRYLENCSGQFYELMSPKEKQNCLLFKNAHKEQAPVLGVAKPSPFDQVLTNRQTPATSPFKQCDPGSINSTLHNVPCTDFSGHHLLEEVPGH